jgi:hypothetical protein
MENHKVHVELVIFSPVFPGFFPTDCPQKTHHRRHVPTLAWMDLHSTATRNAQSSRAFDNMPGEMKRGLEVWENHGKTMGKR